MWKALAFGVVGFFLLIVVALYSGMSLHGDPVTEEDLALEKPE